uniref:PH domain-like protein n=1 Tax=Strongyloides venezuelensis TaxID=75913 RepID=A0A0K0F7Y0_STRVS
MESLQVVSKNNMDLNVDHNASFCQGSDRAVDIFNDTDCDLNDESNKTYKSFSRKNKKIIRTVKMFGKVYNESKNLTNKILLPQWSELLNNRKDVVTIGDIYVKEDKGFIKNFLKSPSHKHCCILETGHLLIYSSISKNEGYLLDLKQIDKIVFEGYANSFKKNGKYVTIKLKWNFGSIVLLLSENEIPEWKEPIFVIHENSDIYEFTKKFYWSHRNKSNFTNTSNREIDTYENSTILSNDSNIEIEYDEKKYQDQLELIRPCKGELDIHKIASKIDIDSSLVNENGSRYDTPRPERKSESRVVIGDYEF